MNSSLLDSGYHPPQFSEESAWLPCWFQHQRVQPLHDEKDLGHRFTNKHISEEAIMSLEDEGRYKSCHLFLSWEDKPSASLCPSSAHVEFFDLHLSSNGITQEFYSSGLGTFRAENTGSDYVALVQKTELNASKELRDTRCIMDNHNAWKTRSHSSASQHETLEHACPQFLEESIDMKTKNKDNFRKHNVSEIGEAVELSIAAAEALIIHDMATRSSSTKRLSTEAILEVALKVKQARLEGLEDSLYHSDEEFDENESMSDFHESDMADAFEDVGLIFCGSDVLVASAVDIFQVKETPNSEILPFNTCTKQELTKIIDMDNHETKKLPVELVDFEGNWKLKNYPTRDLTISADGPCDHIGLQWSVVEKSNVPAAAEDLNLALENMASPRGNERERCSSQAEGYVNDERDAMLHSYCLNKFQSRWLGGWMRKEMDASATNTQRNPNIISKLLVGETSYLSESADVAPDENSHVQIHDEESHMASQPSILFKGHDGADEGAMFYPNTPVSSCLFLDDPLCSVVPCSLSSENTCHSKIHDSNIVDDTEEFSRPGVEHCNGDLRGTFTPSTKCLLGEQQPVLKINGEPSHGTIRRHLTSLRTYSTIVPRCSAFMEKDSSYGKPLVISPNNSSFLYTENKWYARELEVNHETPNQFRQVESKTKAHIEKDRCSPLILNRGKRHRSLTHKEVNLINRGEYMEKSPILEGDVALPKSDHQKDRLSCGLLPNPEMPPPRKRVRFSEACTQRRQKTNVHKKSSYIEGSAAGAGKRIKNSNVKQAKRFQSPHKNSKRLVLRNLEFLLTGFPIQKEREIKNIIRKHDGKVLPGIPSSNLRAMRISRLNVHYHPVVLCPHKLETTEFLYGCVVNAFILRVDWLTDSVKAGSALAPDRYMVISNHVGERSVARPLCRNKHNHIFDGIGIMLHGKHSFCTHLATVIKHGGGKVFKTLQLMVQNLDTKKISSGIIVAEDEKSVSRHLKHCASEGKIHTMAASWIINSLHCGKLLPFNVNTHSSCLPMIRILDFPDSTASSQEI